MSEKQQNGRKPEHRQNGPQSGHRSERQNGSRQGSRNRQSAADGAKTPDENLIEGRNAVREALRAGRVIDRVYVASGETDGTLQQLTAMARQSGAVVSFVDRRKLSSMSPTGTHQGIIAVAAAHDYVSVEEILQTAADRGEAPLLVLCDELTDPHNLGAILRTAECAGAHGVIIPKRRSVGLTAAVARASAGAIEHMQVARVSSLQQTMKDLQKAGIWIYGAAAEGTTDLYQADFRSPAAIVIGNEGAGLGRLIEQTCDYTVSIPMRGQISSLNASVAAAVLLYEAVRQRYSGQ